MSNIDQSLSDLWRENRSRDPGTDLASILDGSRIMAQSLNPEVEVTFTGVEVADTDRRQIYLSPSMLGDKYPVPGDIVDCLLGLTVHEVGHILFSENNTEYIDGLAKKAGYSRYSYGSDYLDFQSLALEKEWVMTPSYEGLAAAIAQLLRLAGRKQKILFHFTDGEPNNGGRQAIAELLQWARIKGIIDIHVCLTSSSFTPERFRRLYGEDTLFINEINQLPDAIDKKLREKLKI